jgi:hypothetical protein
VQQLWTSRFVQTTVKYGDNAPMAAVCCNACRTCTTTNGVSLALAGAIGVGAALARFGRRIVAKPPA